MKGIIQIFQIFLKYCFHLEGEKFLHFKKVTVNTQGRNITQHFPFPNTFFKNLSLLRPKLSLQTDFLIYYELAWSWTYI